LKNKIKKEEEEEEKVAKWSWPATRILLFVALLNHVSFLRHVTGIFVNF